jgi:hypothetical protein
MQSDLGTIGPISSDENFRKVSGNFARESFHCGKFPKRGFCADLAGLRPNLQLIST